MIGNSYELNCVAICDAKQIILHLVVKPTSKLSKTKGRPNLGKLAKVAECP